MKNYYAALQIPAGSDIAEVREAYRRLALEKIDDPEGFAEIQEAYDVLTNATQRTEYDRSAFGKTVVMGGSMPSASRHCPMGAAAQCPVIQAHTPLQDTYCAECGFQLDMLPNEGFEPIAALDPTQQVRFEEANGQTHPLRNGLNSVGREAADVLLADKTVSRHHARVEVTAENSVFVEDIGSTNGTQVNGERLPPEKPRLLVHGDTVRFGSRTVTLHLPQHEIAAEMTQVIMTEAPETDRLARAKLVGLRTEEGNEYPLTQGVTTFGRRPENTIVLRNDPFVSGLHAQIIAEGDTFRLTDVGSTNGTLLNEQRLASNEPELLTPGDFIAIGGSAFRFERLTPLLDEAAPEEMADHEG